ncbi:MAG: 2-oxoacid:acceptor oxidoreductase family protein [Bacillota bacterium]|nr:2-oxoacid:acceptor oxidoreductase family protein [Bacillota bacterium]
MIDVRWYGRGGQGAFTAARILGRIMSVYKGGYALAYPSFGPERRGAPVWSFTRISDSKILDRSNPPVSDYLIILDETLIDDETFKVLKEDGLVIINTAEPEKYSELKFRTVCINATKMAQEYLGRPITNVAMIGAFAAASGLFEIEDGEKVLEDTFAPKLFVKNAALLKASYESVKGGK